MPRNVKDKFLMAIIAIVIALGIGGALLLFTGCSGAGISFDPSEYEKVEKANYFSSVNSISNEFGAALNNFSDCVKDKNTDGMKENLQKTQNLIDDFNKLDLPQSCQDVQKTYSDAFLQLQKALDDYIQIYIDYNSGSMDTAVLNQRVADVQKSYDEGINLLRQADKLASEK